MLNKLRKYFLNEEQEALFIPDESKQEFVLKFKDLIIGYLKVKDRMWIFEYSEEFKNQDQLNALIDFPNKSRGYKSEVLWPFFAHRIPGLGQPQVQEIIKKENIDQRNEADLLKRFGKRTVTNPFELCEA